MSEVEYLLNLHKEGKIDDSALNKALNVLQSVQPSALENLRKKRHKKKKKKRQRQKYAHLKKAVIDELKQVLSQRKSISELKLVDKPLCNHFKT